MSKRRLLLLELIARDRPTETVLRELAEFPWDSDRELVTLERSHLKAVMQDFVAARLTPADVEYWANAVEGREDIGFEAGHAELLNSAVFRLANPLLTEALNVTAATHLIDELSR